jgi:hypothetical protein
MFGYTIDLLKRDKDRLERIIEMSKAGTACFAYQTMFPPIVEELNLVIKELSKRS